MPWPQTTHTRLWCYDAVGRCQVQSSWRAAASSQPRATRDTGVEASAQGRGATAAPCACKQSDTIPSMSGSLDGKPLIPRGARNPGTCNPPHECPPPHTTRTRPIHASVQASVLAACAAATPKEVQTRGDQKQGDQTNNGPAVQPGAASATCCSMRGRCQTKQRTNTQGNLVRGESWAARFAPIPRAPHVHVCCNMFGCRPVNASCRQCHAFAGAPAAPPASKNKQPVCWHACQITPTPGTHAHNTWGEKTCILCAAAGCLPGTTGVDGFVGSRRGGGAAKALETCWDANRHNLLVA